MYDAATASNQQKKPKEQSGTQADAVRDKVNEIADKVNVVGNFVNDVDAQIAYATNGISALLPAMPAAFLLSPALGVPHAHYLHPPSGPPPLPPIPLPPFGPVLLGTCVQVLINKLPAARCGDIGINPTCCGLPPMFEIFTGSSKVFIGGTRAARAFMDITDALHARPARRARGRDGRQGREQGLGIREDRQGREQGGRGRREGS